MSKIKERKIKDFIKTLSGKPFLVFGFGKSGSSAAKALKDAGAQVIVGDDNQDNITRAKELGFEMLSSSEGDFSKYEMLILSPGIPLTHPEPHEIVKKANEAGLKIICDIELFSHIYKNIKTIGVTGTNGKSTVVTLMEHIANKCEVNACLGGNIGTPVFDIVIDEDAKEDIWLILEISSFQIDLCPEFRPDIAVIINITPDHIDRHGSIENYASVKERLIDVCNHSNYNIAVICTDDKYTQKIYDTPKGLTHRNLHEVSTIKTLSSGVYVDDSILYEDGKKIGDLSEIASLKGVHNYQNAACAYSAMRQIGLDSNKIWQAMTSFAGLDHRQFLVRTINGVSYVNDSKATNAASSAVALGARNNVYWIVGGRQKKNGLEGLEEFFPHIKHAFLIGESIDDFSLWMDRYGLEYTRCYNLENALNKAHEMAQQNRGQPGGAGCVLLSPACASFDQFKSFEDRGNKFSELVKSLSEEI